MSATTKGTDSPIVNNSGSGDINQGNVLQNTYNITHNYGTQVDSDKIKNYETSLSPHDDFVYLNRLISDPGKPIVTLRSFDGSTIIGPAVAYLSGNVSFISCRFNGAPKTLFIKKPSSWTSGDPIYGVIELRDVVFRNCNFINIAFMSNDQTIDKILADATKA